MNLLYLQYLTSVCLDATSNTNYEKTVTEVKNQMAFMKEMNSEAKAKVDELEEKYRLLCLLESASNSHESQTKLCDLKNENINECEASNSKLRDNLENNLHQFKMENIHIPEDDDAYCEELCTELKQTISLLSEINNLSESQYEYLKESNDVIGPLIALLQETSNKETIVNQTTGLAVQEASLKITEKKIKL